MGWRFLPVNSFDIDLCIAENSRYRIKIRLSLEEVVLNSSLYEAAHRFCSLFRFNVARSCFWLLRLKFLWEVCGRPWNAVAVSHLADCRFRRSRWWSTGMNRRCTHLQLKWKELSVCLPMPWRDNFRPSQRFRPVAGSNEGPFMVLRRCYYGQNLRKKKKNFSFVWCRTDALEFVHQLVLSRQPALQSSMCWICLVNHLFLLQWWSLSSLR